MSDSLPSNTLDSIQNPYNPSTEISPSTLKKMLDNTSDSIVITDVEGKCIFANSAAERITGFTLSEVLGKKVGTKELWGGLMSTQYYELLWHTIKVEKKPYLGILNNKRKNGEIYPARIRINPIFNTSGEIEMFVCAEQDISEQRVAEEQVVKVLNDLEERSQTLAQEKARIESLLASIGDGIVATDQDGLITMINVSAQEMLGWKLQEVISKPVIDVLMLTDEKKRPLPVSQHPMVLALSTGVKATLPVSPTYYLTRKDGSRFAVGVTVTPFVINNKIVGTIEVIRDVSIEKNIDKAKTEFVSLASHQLRTPLSAINWYTEMLLKGDAGKLLPNQKEFLDIIFASNHRMIALVDSLLNVSRIELGTFTIEPEECDITAIADAVLGELIPKIEARKIRIHKIYKPEQISMFADPKMMNVIFQNLLSNAVKYNKLEGDLTFVIEKRTNEYYIKVADTGLGIPRNDQSQIFQKLFRAGNVTTTDTEGTGLGLYLVKSIIESCKGILRLNSEENVGTTFEIILPLAGMPQVGKAQKR